MSILKPSVRRARERKAPSLWGKVKTASPALSPAASEFEGRQVWAAEAHFVQALRLERKRAERSGQPFLLMLLEGADVFGPDGGSRFLAVTAALAGTIRETDLCGWYQQDQTLGVIFTEVNGAGVVSAVNALNTKVEAALRGCLEAEEVEGMEISFHLFPEAGDGDGWQAGDDSVLYPDVRKRGGAARKLALLTKRLLDGPPRKAWVPATRGPFLPERPRGI
jgi:hypothetical protein